MVFPGPAQAVLPERDLIIVSGLGDIVPGTPDGAVVCLGAEGVAACQVPPGVRGQVGFLWDAGLDVDVM